MWELLNNAWKGWQNYAGKGKYAALLIIVLLFLWFRREECKEKLLLVYTTIMTVCCILPVTAVFLMKFQTGFYSYEWIWSYVPLTIMVAFGGVVIMDTLWKQQEKAKKGILAVAVLLLIFLCGGMGGTTAKFVEPNERQAAEEIILTISENREEEICLWAPKEIMEAARATNGELRLLYGRNIWDAALGACFYEPYGKTEELLYLWMSEAETTGSMEYVAEDGTVVDGRQSITMAMSAGVNRILLPGCIPQEEIQMLSGSLGLDVQALEGYYLLVQ